MSGRDFMRGGGGVGSGRKSLAMTFRAAGGRRRRGWARPPAFPATRAAADGQECDQGGRMDGRLDPAGAEEGARLCPRGGEECREGGIIRQAREGCQCTVGRMKRHVDGLRISST